MKKLIFVLSIASFGLAADEWKGVISDSSCGAKHGPGKENAGCVKSCIGKGGSPVFVTADGKVIKIHNTDAVDAKYYGKAVTLTGKLDGDSVHVEKLAE